MDMILIPMFSSPISINSGNSSPMDMASSVERICDIKAMRDQHYCNISLEYPFEEYPCFKVRQIVVGDDQLNQLITCNECENHTGNRHNRIVRHRLH